MENNFNSVTPRRKQDKRREHLLLAIIAILISAVCYQAHELQARDRTQVISHSKDGGLHNVVVSYRDTVKLDNLPDSECNKLIRDIHLPKGND